MGLTDVQNWAQLRKMQGETNRRLEELADEIRRTNQLLEWLGEVIASAQAPSSSLPPAR